MKKRKREEGREGGREGGGCNRPVYSKFVEGMNRVEMKNVMC